MKQEKESNKGRCAAKKKKVTSRNFKLEGSGATALSTFNSKKTIGGKK